MTRIVTAHQPAYLPWLGLLDKASRADLFVLVDNVQFEENSFINRNKIRTPGGWQWLTVPVKTSGHTTSTMTTMRIAGDQWKKKHWKSFYQHYRKTAYFSVYSPYLVHIYNQPWTFFCDLCEDMLRYLFLCFEITAPILSASDLTITGKKSDYVLDLCRKTEATTFIFGSQGKKYADVEKFRSEGITLIFQEYHHPVYPQCYPGFEPYMTAWDLLFNCGSDSKDIFRGG